MVVSSDGMLGEWSSTLSPREREVALLVARGLSNKEIARELGLSVVHIHSIFMKLGAHKRHAHLSDERQPDQREGSVTFELIVLLSNLFIGFVLDYAFRAAISEQHRAQARHRGSSD